MKNDVKKVKDKKLFNRIMLGLAGIGISAAALATGIALANPNPDSFTYNYTAPNAIGEIWDDTSFNRSNLQLLFDKISGQSNVGFSTLRSMGNAKTTSADMSTNAGGEIIVRMGGLDWTPTYLSTDNQGNTILTLWLSNNEQEAFQDESVHSYQNPTDSKYGFVKGPASGKWGLYSDWAADWYNSSTPSNGTAAYYPSNMYGTSYIRSVTLNNGGQYATSNTALAADLGQDDKNVFAKFTMSDVAGSLADYIVTPLDVSWQEKQSAVDNNGADSSYDCPNDEWNPDATKGKYYSDAFNYQEHNGYDSWKNDKIWLPSMAETGYSDSKNGLWHTSTDQRKNYNGSTTSITMSSTEGTLGENNSSNTSYAYPFSWLRSGFFLNAADYASGLNPRGAAFGTPSVSDSYGVRPAMHLNLTKAAIDSGIYVPTWVEFSADGYAGGDGLSEETAFEISNAAELALLAKRVNEGNSYYLKYFKLTNDIMLAPHEWQPIGFCEDFAGGYASSFQGNFDGAGHTIYGLNIGAYNYCQGLFGYVDYASFKNLNLKSGKIVSGGNRVGSIVGYMEDSSVEILNCKSDIVIDVSSADSSDSFVGGIMGYSGCPCTMKNCYFYGTIIGGENIKIGGLIGYSSSSEITNCITDCVLSGGEVGGLVGKSETTTISNCIARGAIKGDSFDINDSPFVSECGWGMNVSACYFYGAVIGTGYQDAFKQHFAAASCYYNCYMIVNEEKYLVGAPSDAGWLENWAIVPRINHGLPVQKGLFAVGVATNTSEDFVEIFENFEIVG